MGEDLRDPRVDDAQHRLRTAAGVVNIEHPELLQANVGRSCFEFLALARARLGPAEWKYVGKTRADGGKVSPPGFLARAVRYRGQTRDVIAVSHDCLFWVPAAPVDGFPDGVQFDVLASANYWDVPYIDPETGREATASVSGGVIPPHEYRDWNPPIDFEGVAEAPAPPPLPAAPPRALEFPPRDLALEALKALNARYAAGGRPGLAYSREDVERVARDYAGQGEEPTESVDEVIDDLGPRPATHVDHEGLAVWFGDYLRRYATGDHAPASAAQRERHRAAIDAVLADIERAWPR